MTFYLRTMILANHTAAEAFPSKQLSCMATSFYLSFDSWMFPSRNPSRKALILCTSTSTDFGTTLRFNSKNVCLHKPLTIIIMITMMTITIAMTITIPPTAQDCCMLKGTTMMMIVLLMKVCIESSRDISFVFFSSYFGFYYGGYLVPKH